MSLTKFDVAERQLLQAIRLFFDEQDVVAIHTLAEAAAQVLYDLGKGKVDGVFSLARDAEIIRPERKAEWLSAIFSARNFFKHADRDKDKVHTFRLDSNDFALLDATHMYGALKKAWQPETLIFTAWFGLQYPQLILEESTFATVIEGLKRNSPEATSDNKEFFAKAVSELRSGRLSIANVPLAWAI